MDRKFALTGLVYALIGMALGIYMGASHKHTQLVTHAHIMLLGFVVTFIYALCHKLWLSGNDKRLAQFQFYCHQIGVVSMLSGLFLNYGNMAAPAQLEPLLSLGSLAVFIALIVMIVLFVRTPAQGNSAQ